jgi:2-oxoglutarate/2-oxoacid ferredoxin oxidoreductase subunit alpha
MASRNEIVVRFAGEGGQGVVTAAELLARAATAVGYHALTFATFPSQILGGPTWTQARLSTVLVRSPGDAVDVLVAFNEEAYETHQVEVRDGGVVMHDPSFTPTPRDGIKSFAIPFDELAKQTGESRAANMVVLGALAHLVNMPQQYLETFLEARFKGRDTVIEANRMALGLGRDQVKDETPIADLGEPERPEYEQVFVKGNDALSIGALAAGLDYYVGYPISPATPILVFMERHLVGEGKFAYQVSSEIESIASLLGAGFSGKKAMTATSGPGFSLMSEGVGLAWMTEIPAVVVDVQRGGPATGLPTKTEQSDLLAALHPAHGDVELPVIAPGTVEECFYAAIAAINWAERYQGPVIILSEHSLAERAQNIPKPDVSAVKPETREVYQGNNGYLRYDSSELSPMPIPGSPGAYVANGSEHDSYGDTTHLPSRHIQMTERRFSKLKLLEDGTFESENTKEPIALMTWGGSKGSAQDAYGELIEQGVKLAWYYTMFINPLPPALLEELRQKELVIVPELNYLGQFASRLRSLGVNAEAFTQYTGLPFQVKELVQRITDRLGSSAARMVKA